MAVMLAPGATDGEMPRPQVPRPPHQMPVTTRAWPRLSVMSGAMSDLWSQSDTNKITGWMRSGAQTPSLGPWDRDTDGLSGSPLPQNNLDLNTCNNDKQCIDWGDLVTSNQPCCRCTALYCIVLHCCYHWMAPPCRGRASLIIHRESLMPRILYNNGDTNGWDFSPKIFGSLCIVFDDNELLWDVSTAVPVINCQGVRSIWITHQSLIRDRGARVTGPL